MNSSCLVAVLSGSILTLFLLLPDRFSNRNSSQIRKIVGSLAFLHALIAIVGFVALAFSGEKHSNVSPVTSGRSILDGYFLYDQLSSLMLVLVSSVGWVICKFSVRYLDGDQMQGRYFRWTAVTLGAVSLVVLSGNLLVFLICWMVTSLGIHRLLLLYPDRPAAQRAAWAKFTISRIGDVALFMAVCIYYSAYQTLNLQLLFSHVGDTAIPTPLEIQLAGFLLVLGAITKSAQIPFHSWMPLTMETPTPVSALMHAGIVNAGGYLVIRTSPLISVSPSASVLLLAVGGFTAAIAAVIMLTQTSIKKKLAYSTIAQMGFMLLQCGLGAYSIAMLHILAHSIYKAHAFLSSGSVLAQASRTEGLPGENTQPVSIGSFLLNAALVGAVLWAGINLLSFNGESKNGALLLTTILSLGLAHWLSITQATANRALIIRSWSIAGCLCLVYIVAFQAIDVWLSPVIATVVSTKAVFYLSGIVFAAFLAVSILQLRLQQLSTVGWFQSLYIHASNGFYLESVLRRWMGNLLRT